MVSQKLVKEVMEILDKPCNARDISDYIKANNLTNLTSDIKPDICYVLNTLRKWLVIDKLPDLHGMDSNKWYIIKDGNTHETSNCHYCKGIRKAHNKNMAQFIIRSTNRNYKEKEDDDDYVHKDDYIGI